MLSTIRAAGFGLAILAGSLAPVGAPAQTPQNTVASAHALELAQRLVKASGVEKQVDTVVAAMLPNMTAGMSPQLSQQDRAFLTETVLAVLREDFTPRMLERMIPIYAMTFSEAELEAMVVFFESPAGQSMQKKTPVLATAVSSLVQELTPESQAEVVRRVCEKLDCKGARPKVS